jgi:hypothetical protein
MEQQKSRTGAKTRQRQKKSDLFQKITFFVDESGILQRALNFDQ